MQSVVGHLPGDGDVHPLWGPAQPIRALLFCCMAQQSTGSPVRRRLSRKCVGDAATLGVSGVFGDCAAELRVTSAQSVQQAASSSSSEALVSAPAPVLPLLSSDARVERFARQIHRQAWDRIRNLFISTMMATSVVEGSVLAASSRATLRGQFRKDFALLSEEDKSQWAGRAVVQAQGQQVSEEVLLCLAQKAQGSCWATGFFLDRRLSVMLTFNGPWGVVRGVALPSSLLSSKEPMVDICVVLRTVPWVTRLWEMFQQHVLNLVDRLGASSWSACLEVTPDSLLSAGSAVLDLSNLPAKRSVRVHAHVFLDSDLPMTIKTAEQLAWLGSKPHRSRDGFLHSGARGRASRTAASAGHYYVQCPKMTSIFTTCTHPVHSTSGIKPEWVTSYWQQGKMTDDAAISEFLKVKRDCKRHIQNVRDLQTYKRTDAAKHHAAQVKHMLSSEKRPRRCLLAVEQEFLPQFVNLKLHRRKFLVLEGPSGCGKTEFARSLAANVDTIIELNCADTDHVDLRAFSPGQHDLILWDECPALLVLKNKKLFQGQAVDIQLGQTNTSRDAYNVFPWNCKMVVCSNVWTQQLRSLCVADYDWLIQNSVHVNVDNDLWLPAEGGA